MSYAPLAPPLIEGHSFPGTRACVVIPARNEEESLVRILDALRVQEDVNGERLALDDYEVILLLNNCTDASQSVAEGYQLTHSSLHLHIASCVLPPEQAHVGTARRLLMDTACHRLVNSHAAILSTDADTIVAPDWVAQNLAAIDAGADAVGGVIHLIPEDLEALKQEDPGTYRAYLRDRQLQGLVARLESVLDPDPADPWPRHLEHFGASLACTPMIYRLAGGLPPAKVLEDAAFIDELRKIGARIRHCLQTRVFTSARVDGRTEIGLSGQLKLWQTQSRNNEPQLVDSAQWIEHRFRSIATLRRLNGSVELSSLGAFPKHWQSRMAKFHAARLPTPRFLELLDCNALIDEMFSGPRTSEITQAIRILSASLARFDASLESPSFHEETQPEKTELLKT